MEHVKRFMLAVLLSLALPAAAGEQVYVRELDLDATSYTHCSTTSTTAGRGRIVNAGSSTTITTVNSVSGFGQLRAGDEIFVTIPVAGVMTRTRRVISAPSSGGHSSIVLTAALDLSGNGTSGFAWDFALVSCGTGAEDGWLLSAQALWTDVTWQVDQLNVTGGIDVRVQCRGTGPTATAAVTVYPDPANSASTDECKKGNFTAVNACRLIVTGHWSQCRIGFKIGTNDDGGDTGANAESISAFLTTGPAPLQ